MSEAVIRNSVVELVGNTPMVRLDRYFKGAPCTVLGKCDFMNPAGSVKDRIGIAMILDAEASGHIRPGGTIVEATAGNTGLGLCIAAAVKGYNVICVTPDKMSQEKINLMRAFGARVVVTPTVAKDHPEFYTTVAKKIAKETPNAHYIGQFQNQSNTKAHYDTTGPEIWQQTGGKVTAFIASSGTGGTVAGTGKYLKEQNADVQIVLGDPVGSIYAYFSREHNLDGPTGNYKVEGIGNDYIPTTADFEVVDRAYTISDRESFTAARRLARTEGLFCGGSTGCNLAAAQRYIREQQPGKDDVIVVFLCDTGERYLSKVYNDDWMRENQFLSDPTARTAAELVFNKQANAPALITARRDTNLSEVFRQIRALDISQIPVVDDSDNIIGAVTENRVLDVMLNGDDLNRLTVGEVMGEALHIVKGEATPQQMLKLMKESHQEAVLVEQSGGGYDILTKFDLVQSL